MNVRRDGDVFLAKRITGPTHNLLALDFTPGRIPYVKDHASTQAPRVSADEVRAQVDRAIEELRIDASELVGLQFLSDDSRTDYVYYEMAKVIIEHRELGTQLDVFEASWIPEEE